MYFVFEFVIVYFKFFLLRICLFRIMYTILSYHNSLLLYRLCVVLSVFLRNFCCQVFSTLSVSLVTWTRSSTVWDNTTDSITEQYYLCKFKSFSILCYLYSFLQFHKSIHRSVLRFIFVVFEIVIVNLNLTI